MKIDHSQLITILRIGHEMSLQGQGLSLRELLARSSYGQLRKSFGPSDLVPLLIANPVLVKQWLMYSEDKRTSKGYGVSESKFEVDSQESPDLTVRLNSIEEAIAEFVVRELDYWLEVGRTQRSI